MFGHTVRWHTDCMPPTATTPHRDPKVERSLRAYRRAEQLLDRRRSELADAIAEAVMSGRVKQVDMVKQTGYTRETIRRICHDHSARIASRAANPPS